MALFNKGSGDSKAIGVYGALAFLTGALVLAAGMGGIRLLIALAYVAGVCALFSRGSFRDLRQLTRFVPVVIVLSALLWREEYQPRIVWKMPTIISSMPFVSGLLVGVEMSIRAVVMVLAISAFVRTVKFTELSHLFERVSKSQMFSFIFELAFNLTPYLERIARDTMNSIKLRGGFRLRNLVSSVRYMLSSTMLNALAKCDDISYAAEARAFSIGRERAASNLGNQLTATRADFAMLLATAIVLTFAFAVSV
jgi:energy-coupling factor transporter transmembrane protein EcfT